MLIEEPFSLLALASICASIQENVQGLLIAHKEALKLESLHGVPDQKHYIAPCLNFVQPLNT